LYKTRKTEGTLRPLCAFSFRRRIDRRMTTLYLSSTYEDLKEFREAVKLKALHESGDECIVLQDYPAANYRPRTMACTSDN
jgi:hypothetical protein